MESHNSQPKSQKPSAGIGWRIFCVLIIVAVVGLVFELHKIELSVLSIVIGALFFPVSREDADFLTAMRAFFIGFGIVIAGSWFKLFWLIAIIGLVLALAFWRHRGGRSLKATFAFVGILVTLYGLLGVAFQLA